MLKLGFGLEFGLGLGLGLGRVRVRVRVKVINLERRQYIWTKVEEMSVRRHLC
jgi:hypothetical protein